MSDLPQIKNNTLPLVKISETRDLFKAKPIVLQVQDHGEIPVLTEIRVSLEKCAIGLDMKMDDNQIEILCQDILEVYSHDSIEDIQSCFKKARQGRYGFGFNKRTSITMELFKEWMAKHLEDKAEAREKIIHNRKQEEENIATPEEAGKYLAEIKKIIQNSMIKEPSKEKPVVDHKNTTSWKEVMEKTKDSIDRCMEKIETGEELTEDELIFLRAWNVKI